MKSYSAQDINTILKGELIGNTKQLIEGPEQLEKAQNNHITFIGSQKYVKLWADSKASVAIINDNLKVEPGEHRALIKVKNADLAMAKILEMIGLVLVSVMILGFVGALEAFGIESGLTPLFWGCAGGTLIIIMYRKRKRKQAGLE